MNNTQLIEILEEKAFIDLTEKQWKQAIDSIFLMIESKVKEGKIVRMYRFGSFRKVQRKERIGKNPKTGEVITIPMRYVIKFRPSSSFKRKVK